MTEKNDIPALPYNKNKNDNFTNNVKLFRWVLDKIIGIHRDRKLPKL